MKGTRGRGETATVLLSINEKKRVLCCVENGSLDSCVACIRCYPGLAWFRSVLYTFSTAKPICIVCVTMYSLLYTYTRGAACVSRFIGQATCRLGGNRAPARSSALAQQRSFSIPIVRLQYTYRGSTYYLRIAHAIYPRH